MPKLTTAEGRKINELLDSMTDAEAEGCLGRRANEK